MTKRELLCVGSAIADIIAWPVDSSVLAHAHLHAEKIILGPGGCGGNLSIGVAALGHQVDLIAKVGEDYLGRMLRDELHQRGVGLSRLVVDPEDETGRTLVLVDTTGERRFVYAPGANAHLCSRDLADIPLSDYRALHISDIFLLPLLEANPLVNLLQSARRAGCHTSLDTIWDGSGRWLASLEPYLPLLDLLFVSEEEAEHIFPELSPERQVDRFLEMGVGRVILKRGARGCVVGSGDLRECVCPAEARPVDTTGAGDAFAAGYLAGYLEGLSPLDAARAGTMFAVHSLGYLGATKGMGRHASVAAFTASMDPTCLLPKT